MRYEYGTTIQYEPVSVYTEYSKVTVAPMDRAVALSHSYWPVPVLHVQYRYVLSTSWPVRVFVMYCTGTQYSVLVRTSTGSIDYCMGTSTGGLAVRVLVPYEWGSTSTESKANLINVYQSVKIFRWSKASNLYCT